jgi:signal transduction histidine kinase
MALETERHARDEFFAVAAHDLKTPLCTLGLQVQSVERALAGNDWARQRLRSMGRQVTHMTRLIGRLLDVSQISGGGLRLHVEELDLASLVRSVVDRLGDELVACGSTVNLLIEGPVVGRWDRTRLDQIVTNLLTNAIKYGRGLPIDVIVDGDDWSARIIVRDRGIGIAPADQERVFQKFERAAPSSVGSVGLGLWIVRSIVDASGGRVGLSSEPGAGSTFTIRLPKRAPSML